MSTSQFFFYLLLFVLLVGVLQGMGIGVFFLLKNTGERRANYCYGLLLITFALTVLHNVWVMTGVFERMPQLYFLPIYFTLAFPVLLFYHTKLSLYPLYQFVWSDVKHFILPFGQLIFFCVLFFMPIAYKSQLGRNFYNPFFGALEQLLYLSTFFAYLYFSRRYIIQKQKETKDRVELRRALYLRILIRIFFILFCIHTVFVVADFVCYEFFDINLRTVKPYAALGALSFVALLYWLGVYGLQVLFWGRRIFGKGRGL